MLSDFAIYVWIDVNDFLIRVVIWLLMKIINVVDNRKKEFEMMI